MQKAIWSRIITAVTAAGLSVAVLSAVPASAGDPEADRSDHHHLAAYESRETHNPEVWRQLWKVRKATENYQDYEVALADGYHKPDPWACYESEEGAMGYHHLMPSRVDNEFDIEKPELMIYLPTEDGEMRLVAVEYMQPDADQDLSTDDDRPTLFDTPFNGPMLGHEPGMPIHYDLHVWIYDHNPNGVFAQWNPTISCPRDAETN